MTAIKDRVGALKGRVITELVDVRTAQVVRREQSNLITTVGLERVTDFLVGAAPASPDYIAIGTGAETEYAESNQDTDVDLTSSGADQQIGQGFQLTNAQQCDSIPLWLKRTGTSPGSLTVEVQGDDSGKPDGVAITGGVSSSVAINGIETTYDWIRFVFPDTPSLLAATQYHLVIKSSGYTYANGVTEVVIGVDESAPGYANGVLSEFNGTVWAARSPAADAVFRVIATATAAMTAVVDEVDRNQASSKSEQTTTTARLLAVFGAAEAVDTHGMVGLFDIAAAGNMYAVANISIKKTNVQVLNVYWLISVT